MAVTAISLLSNWLTVGISSLVNNHHIAKPSLSLASVLSSMPSVIRTRAELEALFKNPSKLRTFIREGVPPELRRDVWRHLILGERKLPDVYNSTLIDRFGDACTIADSITSVTTTAASAGAPGVASVRRLLPSWFPVASVPDFGNPLDWNGVPHMTHDEARQVQSIIAVLALNNPMVSHSPLLVDMASLLIRIQHHANAPLFTASECYAMLQTMLTQSIRDGYWFTTNGSAFKRFVQSFALLCKQRLPKLYNIMTKLNINIDRLFEGWYTRLFVSYLSTDTLLRMLDCFLLDGSAVLVEVALAVLVVYEDILLRSTSSRQFLHNLDRLLSLDDPGVIATATNLGLSRSAILRLTHSHATATRSALHRARIPLFNIPRLGTATGSASFLTHRHFVNLWYYLPSELYIQNPVRIFSASDGGYSLRSVLNVVGGDDRPHFLVVREVGGAVFGVMMMQAWRPNTRDSALDGRCFVFTLEPTFAVYGMMDDDDHDGDSSSLAEIARHYRHALMTPLIIDDGKAAVVSGMSHSSPLRPTPINTSSLSTPSSMTISVESAPSLTVSSSSSSSSAASALSPAHDSHLAVTIPGSPNVRRRPSVYSSAADSWSQMFTASAPSSSSSDTGSTTSSGTSSSSGVAGSKTASSSTSDEWVVVAPPACEVNRANLTSASTTTSTSGTLAAPSSPGLGPRRQSFSSPISGTGTTAAATASVAPSITRSPSDVSVTPSSGHHLAPSTLPSSAPRTGIFTAPSSASTPSHGATGRGVTHMYEFLNSLSTDRLYKEQDVKTLGPDATMADTLTFLATHRLVSAPIIARDGRYLGSVDVMDLLHHLLSKVPAAVHQAHAPQRTAARGSPIEKRFVSADDVDRLHGVGRAAAREPLSSFCSFADDTLFPPLREKTTVADLVAWFASGHYRSPVCDARGRLVGVMSQSSIITVIAESLTRPEIASVVGQSLIDLHFTADPLQVPTIRKSDTVLAALRTIQDSGEEGLAVIDDDGKLVGNFSASDLRAIAATHWTALLLTVHSFLSSNHPSSLSPVSTTGRHTLSDVIRLMADRKIHRIWIVDDLKKPIGVVATSDVLDVLRWHLDHDMPPPHQQQLQRTPTSVVTAMVGKPIVPEVKAPGISVSDSGISIGDASGTALSLDASLAFGFTQSCHAYSSPQLAPTAIPGMIGGCGQDGRFQIMSLEIWAFTSELNPVAPAPPPSP